MNDLPESDESLRTQAIRIAFLAQQYLPNNFAVAEKSFQSAEEMFLSIKDKAPEDWFMLGAGRLQIAHYYYNHKQPDKACESYKKSLAFFEVGEVWSQEQSERIVSCYTRLGTLYARQYAWDELERVCEKVVSLLPRLHTIMDHDCRDIAGFFRLLGFQLANESKWPRSKYCLEQALVIMDAITEKLSDDENNIRDCHDGVRLADDEMQKTTALAQVFAEVLLPLPELEDEALDAELRRRIQLLLNVAVRYDIEKDTEILGGIFGRSIPLYEKLKSISEEEMGQLALHLQYMGDGYFQRANYPKAEEVFVRGVGYLRQISLKNRTSRDSANLVSMCTKLCRSNHKQANWKKLQKSIDLVIESLAQTTKPFDDVRREIAKLSSIVGAMHAADKSRLGEAVDAYTKCITLMKGIQKKESGDKGLVQLYEKQCQSAQKQQEEAARPVYVAPLEAVQFDPTGYPFLLEYVGKNKERADVAVLIACQNKTPSLVKKAEKLLNNNSNLRPPFINLSFPSPEYKKLLFVIFEQLQKKHDLSYPRVVPPSKDEETDTKYRILFLCLKALCDPHIEEGQFAPQAIQSTAEIMIEVLEKIKYQNAQDVDFMLRYQMALSVLYMENTSLPRVKAAEHAEKLMRMFKALASEDKQECSELVLRVYLSACKFYREQNRCEALLLACDNIVEFFGCSDTVADHQRWVKEKTEEKEKARQEKMRREAEEEAQKAAENKAKAEREAYEKNANTLRDLHLASGSQENLKNKTLNQGRKAEGYLEDLSEEVNEEAKIRAKNKAESDEKQKRQTALDQKITACKKLRDLCDRLVSLIDEYLKALQSNEVSAERVSFLVERKKKIQALEKDVDENYATVLDMFKKPEKPKQMLRKKEPKKENKSSDVAVVAAPAPVAPARPVKAAALGASMGKVFTAAVDAPLGEPLKRNLALEFPPPVRPEKALRKKIIKDFIGEYVQKQLVLMGDIIKDQKADFEAHHLTKQRALHYLLLRLHVVLAEVYQKQDAEGFAEMLVLTAPLFKAKRFGKFVKKVSNLLMHNYRGVELGPLIDCIQRCYLPEVSGNTPEKVEKHKLHKLLGLSKPHTDAKGLLSECERMFVELVEFDGLGKIFLNFEDHPMYLNACRMTMRIIGETRAKLHVLCPDLQKIVNDPGHGLHSLMAALDTCRRLFRNLDQHNGDVDAIYDSFVQGNPFDVERVLPTDVKQFVRFSKDFLANHREQFGELLNEVQRISAAPAAVITRASF